MGEEVVVAGWLAAEGAVRVELLVLGADWLPNEGGGEVARDWLGAAGRGGAEGEELTWVGRLGMKVGTMMLGGGGAGIWLAADVSGVGSRLESRCAGLVWLM